MDATPSTPGALLLIFAAFFVFPIRSSAFQATSDNGTLAIINAGVSSSEDAPFVSKDYKFLPGDNVYFTFEIAGFSVRSEQRGEVKKISLHFETQPTDDANRSLTEATTGDIDAELSPEDKNWIPKRRASFPIPSFVGAGLFRVHVIVKDSFAKTEATRDVAFRVGGIEVKPSPSITVQNFRFLRRESDLDALSVPAYSIGDTVYARFEITGFHSTQDNLHHVAYGVTVFAPNGKPYIQAPEAANLKAQSFYPAQFLPGSLELNIAKASARGEYIVVLTVRDLLADQKYEMRQAFSVE